VETASLLTVGTAALAGLAFGYCAQRGGFCLTRAVSNCALMGDASLLRAYALAFLVATIGTHLLPLGLVEEIPVRPFHWVASLAGGLVFGVGMIVAGGCAGSSWYRVGEGALGAWVVLAGFAVGATATTVGVLQPLRAALGRYETETAETLDRLLGWDPWLLIAVLALVLGAWLIRGRGEPTSNKWPWPLTGVAVGVVIALGWYLSALGGTTTGITFASNTGHLLTYPLVGYPNRLTWGMILVTSVAVGAALAAWRSGEFAWKPVPPGTVGKLFAGGLTMGVGALIADGCNITQGLTNGATLALGSLVAFSAMLAGGWATLWALYLRKT
jgi:uncharacterized protein